MVHSFPFFPERVVVDDDPILLITVQAMAQFPEDVKLTRDALALLGHVASTEHLGQTFLTTHSLYREVVLVLRRHVADAIVGVSVKGPRNLLTTVRRTSVLGVSTMFVLLEDVRSPQAESAGVIRSKPLCKPSHVCALLVDIGGVIAATCCASPA